MAWSGSTGFLCILLSCIVFCTTGHFINQALHLVPASMSHTYPGLGEAALGTLGRRLVSATAATSLSLAACMLLIVFWRSLEVSTCVLPSPSRATARPFKQRPEAHLCSHDRPITHSMCKHAQPLSCMALIHDTWCEPGLLPAFLPKARPSSQSHRHSLPAFLPLLPMHTHGLLMIPAPPAAIHDMHACVNYLPRRHIPTRPPVAHVRKRSE